MARLRAVPLQILAQRVLLLAACLGTLTSAMNLSPQQVGAGPAAGDSEGRDGSVHVLVFLAVGKSQQTMETTKKNIHNLKRHSFVESEVYMAHYDNSRDVWQKEDREWYEHHVNYSVEDHGGKFLMAQAHLPVLLAERRYDWIWLVDEDVDFSHTNLTRMFLDAAQTTAYIVQPALRSNPGPASMRRHTQASLLALQVSENCQPGEAMCNHLTQNRQCMYRYVNLVEVMTPIIRHDALVSILTGCLGCIHEHSVWGLDKMWCAWIAEQNHKLDTTGCAILDRVTVYHQNQRTLSKWDKSGNRRFDVIQRDYWGAWHDVRDHYEKYFIPDLGHTHRCVPPTHFDNT